MHLYPLIIAAICFQKAADLHQPFAAWNPVHIVSAMAALQVVLVCITAVLENILPTVAAMMPDKAPLLIGAWTGCNALALRISYGLSKPHMKKQVSQ